MWPILQEHHGQSIAYIKLTKLKISKHEIYKLYLKYWIKGYNPLETGCHPTLHIISIHTKEFQMYLE
jgi:hypothetical protein